MDWKQLSKSLCEKRKLFTLWKNKPIPGECEFRGSFCVPTQDGHLHPASKSRSTWVYARFEWPPNASSYQPIMGTTRTSADVRFFFSSFEFIFPSRSTLIPVVPGNTVGEIRTPHSTQTSISAFSFPNESSGYPSRVASFARVGVAAGNQSSWLPKTQNTSSNFCFNDVKTVRHTSTDVATSPATISALFGGYLGNWLTHVRLAFMSACRSDIA
mmetsp:Transcript_4022/g.14778  ORF Transcript_4022/g.14778 Transcript_4022/m.14778 type:complete len:214 (+) Transcript_4022:416-1057(+)